MDPFLGEIRAFSWDWAPRGWALCAGQILPIAQNSALFSLLGTMYGGDGRTTFGLPDLRGRVPIDRSQNEPQGAIDGAEQVTLTVGTMPAHAHPLIGTSATAGGKQPNGNVFANDTAPGADFYAADSNPALTIAPGTVGLAGGSQPHPNMQPYLVLNYCIAVSGLFPARN